VRESDIDAVLEALRSGWLTMGPRIQAFEAEFAAYVGAEHAVAVSSGTAGLHLAVRTVAPGARVAVPALGGDAAAAAVRASGGTVAAWDAVSAEDPTPDPDALPDADAAVLVHSYGFRARAPQTAVPLIEDCRAALGLGVGRAGVAACWSFADGRPLGMGEGGCVTTDDAGVAARVRLLRQHAMTSGTWDRHRGHSDSYDVVDIGFNFRLDEPRAALGSAQLAHLDSDLEARRTVEAMQVDDVPAALAALQAAGIDARAVAAPGLPHAAAAAARLVRLPPGADRDAAARAVRSARA
jgi:dTDP-4-amino-4,6-dideoxygalactose transaminase